MTVPNPTPEALVAKWREHAAESKRYGTSGYKHARASELVVCAAELAAARATIRQATEGEGNE